MYANHSVDGSQAAIILTADMFLKKEGKDTHVIRCMNCWFASRSYPQKINVIRVIRVRRRQAR